MSFRQFRAIQGRIYHNSTLPHWISKTEGMKFAIPRLYMPGAHLTTDALVRLPLVATAHLTTSLRLRNGDQLRVFNNFGEWQCEIVDGAEKGQHRPRSQLIVRPIHQRRPHLGPRRFSIHLMFAPIRPSRMQGIIECATELGVNALWPVSTDRCQYVDRGTPNNASPPIAIARRRDLMPYTSTEKTILWAIDAAQQSERLDVPSFLPAMTLNEVIATWSKDFALQADLAPALLESCKATSHSVLNDAGATRLLLVCDELSSEARGGENLVTVRELLEDVLQRRPQIPHHLVLGIIVGPEGGWSDSERDYIQAAERKSVGSSCVIRRVGIGGWAGVLRTETACAAALVAAQEAYEAATRRKQSGAVST